MNLLMQILHRHCFRTFASDKVQCKVHCCILIVWVYVQSLNLFETASTTFPDLKWNKNKFNYGFLDSIDDQYASKRTQKQNSIPDHVPKKYLQQRKQESELTATLQTKTQDIIIFLIFITVMLLVVHNHRPVEQCFQQSQTVNNMFIKKKFDFVSTSLSGITTISVKVVYNNKYSWTTAKQKGIWQKLSFSWQSEQLIVYNIYLLWHSILSSHY